MSVNVYVAGEIGDDCLNLANGNFLHVFNDVLGLEVDWVGELDPALVLERVQRAEAAVAQGRGSEFVRPTTHVGNIVICGLDEPYIQHRLGAIRKIAQRALDRGVVVRYG